MGFRVSSHISVRCYNVLMFNTKDIKLNPVLMLRLGLGAVFIYAGLSSLVSPFSWVGFVPQWVGVIMPIETFLIFHGVFEVLLGVVLISGFFLRIVSILAFLSLLSIIVFFGVDEITFRDFGLLMMALALFLLSKK